MHLVAFSREAGELGTALIAAKQCGHIDRVILAEQARAQGDLSRAAGDRLGIRNREADAGPHADPCRVDGRHLKPDALAVLAGIRRREDGAVDVFLSVRHGRIAAEGVPIHYAEIAV